MNTNTNKAPKATWLHMCILAIATLIAYSKVYNAGFLSWDDGEYILRNGDIRGISANHIRAWFSHYYVGNYHPLTMLTYAVDYAVGALHPFMYHMTSLSLHVCNGCLVYVLIKKLQTNVTVAFFVALLFSIHPMQTESVSWVAERKTVLSGLFFLMALIQYTNYSQKPSHKKMLGVLAAGAAAMLSKGTAVALPVSLFAIDIWLRRPLNNRKIWIEKIPLICMSLVVGLVALNAQESGKFIDSHPGYGVSDSMLYAGYAYVMYIIRFLVPIQLSAMYTYPQTIGMEQYVFLLFAIGLMIVAYVAYQKKWSVLCGGLLFYTANIIFLLQLIPFGEALMADRYIYIASIGLVYPGICYLFNWPALKENTTITATGIIATLLLAATFVRNTAWQSDTNFFSAMLESHPNSSVAEYSVGAMFMKNGDYTRAELHLDRAVLLDPRNFKAWYNKGALHLRQGKTTKALAALDRSIAISGYYKAYFTRALLHHATRKIGLALADIEHVLAVQPGNARAWHIKGDCLAQQGNLKAAIENYNKAIEYKAAEPIFYIRRGLTFSRLKNHQQAIGDLNAAVALNPANGQSLYYRGMVKFEAGQSPCPDLQRALQLGYKRAADMLGKLCVSK